jgi:F420-dependent oxidoreductase-like protein
MRTGIVIGATPGETTTLTDLVAQAKQIEEMGLDDIWMANITTFDAIEALAILGWETERVGLGTAVTPTYPRHPTAIAQQALTTAAASGNRFSLGIGLSHKMFTEDLLGFSFDKPARHMREYLSVLAPLLRGEVVNYEGEEYRVRGFGLQVQDAERVPLLVAALGPVMLKLAGELADGTITWMVGPKTMEEHIVARLGNAARAAGRPDPTVVGGFPVLLTNKPDEARAKINEMLAIYGQLPSYRAMLDREGMAGPGEVAMLGDENYLRGAMDRLRDVGVTHFNAAIMPVEKGGFERTVEFLSSLKG